MCDKCRIKNEVGVEDNSEHTAQISMAKDEKISSMLQRNPYCIQCGKTRVELTYLEHSICMRECIKTYIREIKKNT